MSHRRRERRDDRLRQQAAEELVTVFDEDVPEMPDLWIDAGAGDKAARAAIVDIVLQGVGHGMTLAAAIKGDMFPNAIRMRATGTSVNDAWYLTATEEPEDAIMFITNEDLLP